LIETLDRLTGEVGLARRSLAIKDRKAQLVRLLERAGAGLQFNEHIDGEDGAAVFAHACKLECEGIVSKLKGSHYRSGRSRDWLKSKNPASAAVRREATEDWGRRRGVAAAQFPISPRLPSGTQRQKGSG